MDTGTTDKRSRSKNLISKIYNFIKKFFRKRKKEKVTINQLYSELRCYSKNNLVRELITQAQINNKNLFGIDSEFKKDIKKYSKKKIIKSIILLRLKNDKMFDKKLKEILKESPDEQSAI